VARFLETHNGDGRRRLDRCSYPAEPAFWERLLTRWPPGKLNYEMALWRPALHRAFPDSRRRRAEVHKPLPGLRDLRNRIAHHEPIFSRDLVAEYQTIQKRLRDNLAAVGRDTALHKQTLDKLGETEASITTLSTAIEHTSAEIETAKEQLQAFVSALTL
jgi:hypothetical protein